MERRRRQRPGGKVHGRRRAAKNLLVGPVKEKVVMVEKVRSKDLDRDRSQLKEPLKTADAKTKRDDSET